MLLVFIDGTAQSKVDRGLNGTNLIPASGTLVLQKSFKIADLVWQEQLSVCRDRQAGGTTASRQSPR